MFGPILKSSNELGKRSSIYHRNKRGSIPTSATIRLVIVTILSLLIGFSIASENDGPLQIGDHHVIQISSSNFNTLNSKTRTYTLDHKGASFLSLHFKGMNLPSRCSLEIKNGNGDQIETLRGMGKHNLGSFWARHVDGDTIDLFLHCAEGIEDAQFEIDDYVSGYPNGSLEKENNRNLRYSKRDGDDHPFFHSNKERDLSICKADNKRNAVCYKQSDRTHYQTARAVARLYINGSGGCTGWLVKSPNGNMLLTNNHCIRNQADALNTEFQFDSEEDNCSSTGSSDGSWMSHKGVSFDGVQLLVTDRREDFSLIQLEGNPASQYGELELDTSYLTSNYEIYIPQHPGGRPKEIAMFDDNVGGQCRILLNDSRGCTGGVRDISYSCDTEGGSSGSPVISHTTHKVIGLHHCGGGCNGNKGVPVINFIDKISPYISKTTPGKPNPPITPPTRPNPPITPPTRPNPPPMRPPTPAPPTRSPRSPTSKAPVHPGAKHCLKYGDSFILQVNNMNNRWLEGGYPTGNNKVETRNFTGEKMFNFRWIAASSDPSNPKTGNCVQYNDIVYIENHQLRGKWLKGGLGRLKQGVKLDNRYGNQRKYRWTIKSPWSNNNANVQYGDKITLQVNNAEDRWLSGGRKSNGQKGKRVISSDMDNDNKMGMYRLTVRSDFGDGTRDYKDPLAP